MECAVSASWGKWFQTEHEGTYFIVYISTSSTNTYPIIIIFMYKLCVS